MFDYVENHPNGDGYWHNCSQCLGSISESESMVFADGQAMHAYCFENLPN